MYNIVSQLIENTFAQRSSKVNSASVLADLGTSSFLPKNSSTRGSGAEEWRLGIIYIMSLLPFVDEVQCSIAGVKVHA